MYSAIIFDFFDVIRTDSFKQWLRLHDYKLEGEFLEVNQRMDRGEVTTDEFFATLGKITGQPAAEIFEEMEAEATVDYEVLALIERLKVYYKIGLLSNAPSAFLRNLLHEHDLEKYFDEIVISSEVALTKPSPEIFHHILAKMGAQPGESIFIDDNPRNVDGANAIGITGILYTDALALEKDLKKLIIDL